MAPASTATEVDAIEEKPPVLPASLPNAHSKKNKNGVATNEKTISTGETVPGWTIMRPIRMRPLKGKKGSGSGLTANVSDIDGSYNDRKSNGDLKVTETGESGLGAAGDVENLNELRSDDELLGEDEENNAQPKLIKAVLSL